MVLTVGLPLGGRVAINPGRPLVEMAAGPGLSLIHI